MNGGSRLLRCGTSDGCRQDDASKSPAPPSSRLSESRGDGHRTDTAACKVKEGAGKRSFREAGGSSHRDRTIRGVAKRSAAGRESRPKREPQKRARLPMGAVRSRVLFGDVLGVVKSLGKGIMPPGMQRHICGKGTPWPVETYHWKESSPPTRSEPGPCEGFGCPCMGDRGDMDFAWLLPSSRCGIVGMQDVVPQPRRRRHHRIICPATR